MLWRTADLLNAHIRRNSHRNEELLHAVLPFSCLLLFKNFAGVRAPHFGSPLELGAEKTVPKK